MVGFDLLRHGAKLEAEFLGALLDVVSVKLLDIFEVGGEQDKRVESGERSQGILQEGKELDIVCPSRAIGDG